VEAAAGVAAGKSLATAASANVAALTVGVLKTMFLTKLKTAMTVLLVLGIVAFGGVLLYHDSALGQQVKAEQVARGPQ
jgi:hypothetical protein